MNHGINKYKILTSTIFNLSQIDSHEPWHKIRIEHNIQAIRDRFSCVFSTINMDNTVADDPIDTARAHDQEKFQ